MENQPPPGGGGGGGVGVGQGDFIHLSRPGGVKRRSTSPQKKKAVGVPGSGSNTGGESRLNNSAINNDGDKSGDNDDVEVPLHHQENGHIDKEKEEEGSKGSSSDKEKGPFWPSWVSCIVCKDRDNEDPDGTKELLVLPCYHVVCKDSSCVERLFNHGEEVGDKNGTRSDKTDGTNGASCPECLRVVTHSVESLSVFVRPIALQKHHTTLSAALNDLNGREKEAESSAEKVLQVCTLCIRGGRATSFCKECQKHLCQICTENHPYGITSKDHAITIFAPNDEHYEASSVATTKCDFHRTKEATIYCNNCEAAICVHCLTSHHGHSICSLSEGMDMMMKDVGAYQEQLIQEMKEMERLVLVTHTKQEQIITTENERLAQELKSALATLTDLLASFERDYKRELVQKVSEKVEVLRAKELQCTNTVKCVFQYSQFLRTLIESKDISSALFVEGCRFAKRYFHEQMKLIAQFTGPSGEEFFGLHESPLQFDTSWFMELAQSIRGFGKLVAHDENETSAESPTHLPTPSPSPEDIGPTDGFSVGTSEPEPQVLCPIGQSCSIKQEESVPINHINSTISADDIPNSGENEDDEITYIGMINHRTIHLSTETARNSILSSIPLPFLHSPSGTQNSGTNLNQSLSNDTTCAPTGPSTTTVEDAVVFLSPHDQIQFEQLKASKASQVEKKTSTRRTKFQKKTRKSQQKVRADFETSPPPVTVVNVSDKAKNGNVSGRDPPTSTSSRIPGVASSSTSKRVIKRKLLDPEFVSSADIDIDEIERNRPAVAKSKVLTKNPKIPDDSNRRKRPKANPSDKKKPPPSPTSSGEDSEHEDYCCICRDGGENLICCEVCPKVFHTGCHIPAFSGVPKGKFYCNFCKSKEAACDPSKGDEKLIRYNAGIQRDVKVFYKACKFLSEIFKVENELHDEINPKDEEEQDTDTTPSPFWEVKNRLAKCQPSPYKDAKEMLDDWSQFLKAYMQKLHAEETQSQEEAIQKFESQIDALLNLYYPDYYTHYYVKN